MDDYDERGVATYIRFFESLTDESIEDFRQFAAPDVRYRDPFIDCHGPDEVIAAMHHWFEVMEDLTFDIDQHARAGDVVLGHWTMRFHIKKMPRQAWCLEGMSKVTFDDQGRVRDAIDYWDATPLLGAIPVLGTFVRLAKRVAS